LLRRTLALVLVIGLPAAGQAATRETERLQIQMAALQSQVNDLLRLAEDNLRELRRLNEALAEQRTDLKRSVQDRKSQDEQFQASLKDVQEKLSDLQGALQQATLVPTGAPAPGTPGSTPPGGAPPPAPKELYSQAYADYARGNFDLAIQGYQEYIRSYPDTDLTDNAQYWIGECHYSKQKFEDAIEAWNVLLRDYPSSEKVPDARFKKGMALERMGRRSAAMQEYKAVVDRYPNSDAGRKAKEKLSPQ
jgi:tol-pal system protein YbgF